MIDHLGSHLYENNQRLFRTTRAPSVWPLQYIKSKTTKIYAYAFLHSIDPFFQATDFKNNNQTLRKMKIFIRDEVNLCKMLRFQIVSE